MRRAGWTSRSGLAFSYYVWDGRRERLISVKVVGTEKVWTEVGWFDTVKIELLARGDRRLHREEGARQPAAEGGRLDRPRPAADPGQGHHAYAPR
jgi:hypothetical protein